MKIWLGLQIKAHTIFTRYFFLLKKNLEFIWTEFIKTPKSLLLRF